MDNWLFKYFYDFCNIYTCIKYILQFLYIFTLVPNFVNTIMKVETCNSVNEISKNIYITYNIFEVFEYFHELVHMYIS